MIDTDLIARSHFTTKADGESSFYEFVKSLGVLHLEIEFEYLKGISTKGKPRIYRAVSWGGYFNADNEWVVFISWRCAAIDATRYLRWNWDAENKCVYNQRDDEWLN